MIVLDASAGVDFLLWIRPQADLIAERLVRPGETLHAPHVFDAEVFSVIRNRNMRGVLASGRAWQALVDLSDMRMVRYPILPLLDRMWSLRENLSAFDAAYVSLAEALAAPLVTTDARLAHAPRHRAHVELYP